MYRDTFCVRDIISIYACLNIERDGDSFFSILPPHIDGSDELLDWIGLETNNIKSIHEK